MSRRTQHDPLQQIEQMRNLLGFLLIGAFIGSLVTFTFVALPESNKDIITYMVGQLSGMALTVLGFYFVNKVGADAMDAKRSDNTNKLADAVNKALDSTPSANSDAAAEAADATAEAAVEKADEIKGNM